LAQGAHAIAGPHSAVPSILIEASTGQVLNENLADRPAAVGTLAQLMVVLLSIEQAKLGVLPLDVPIAVGPRATAAGGGAEAGVPLRDDRAYLLSELIKAILVASAPDAAVAVGEAISGTVENCLEVMNARAGRLEMGNTRFAGLGAAADGAAGTTTARDLARLARVLVADENVLRWSAVGGIPFDESNTVLRNRNRLVGAFAGADGLATLEIPKHYGILATANRRNLRLIAIVLEAPTSEMRYELAAKLLDWGFANFERIEVVRRGERLNVSIRIDNGTAEFVTPVAAESLSLVQPRRRSSNLVLRYQVPGRLRAPLTREQGVGELIVEEESRLLGVIRAVLPSDVEADGFFAGVGR
jgi:D-alanyl-D-alanine carboxypeptidase (penicillin-binding protein 5/6)